MLAAGVVARERPERPGSVVIEQPADRRRPGEPDDVAAAEVGAAIRLPEQRYTEDRELGSAAQTANPQPVGAAGVGLCQTIMVVGAGRGDDLTRRERSPGGQGSGVVSRLAP